MRGKLEKKKRGLRYLWKRVRVRFYMDL